MDTASIVLITGVTVSGKTRLTEELQRVCHIKSIQSIVSRPPRTSDPEGDYEYVASPGEIKALYERGELVTIPSESSGHLYGMRRKNVEQALADGGLYVRSLTPNVLKAWYELAGRNIVFLHLATPSKDEARRRWIERGEIDMNGLEKRFAEEENWDSQIDSLITEGLPINLVPRGTVEETVCHVLDILFRKMHGL